MTETRDLIRSLASCECPFCDGVKKHAQTFCRNCYYRLPVETRHALYQRVGSGYEEAFQEAMRILGERSR